MSTYANACRVKNWYFEPVALNTFGGMGPQTGKILGRIIDAVAVKFDAVPSARGFLENVATAVYRADEVSYPSATFSIITAL